MPEMTNLSKSARQIMRAMPEQPGEAITRLELTSRARVTEAVLLAALRELEDRHWVEHTEGEGWRITPLGQSAWPRKPVTPALSQAPEGTIILHAPRDRGFALALLIVTVLFVLLWVGLLVLRWKGVGIVLLLVVVVWLGLLLNAWNRWTQVARLTPTTLLTRTWYGRNVRTPRESIAQIALVRVHFGGASKGATTLPYLLFLNAQGHCLNWLLTEALPADAEKGFAHHCGVPLRDLRGQEKSPRQLTREFPDTTIGKRAVKALAVFGAIVLALALTVLLLIAAGAFA